MSSFDWRDPLGLRGSRLDPLTHLTDALLGRGLAAESAARMSTAIARQLEGRRLEISSRPPVAATVERLHDVRPPAGVGALPTDVVEVPVFRSIEATLRTIEAGDIRVDRVDLTARQIRMGTMGDRLRIGGVDYVARIATDDVPPPPTTDGAFTPMVRFDRGRIEATDRRLARWWWIELAVRAADEQVVVEPVALRFRDRPEPIPLPRRARRAVVRDVPGLPAAITVESAAVDGDHVVLRGRVREVVVPVDVTRLLTDLGTQTSRSVLRVMVGER